MKTVLKGKVVVFGASKPMILEQLTAPFDPRWAGLYGDPPTELRDEDDNYFDPPSEPWNPWLKWKVGNLTDKDFTPQKESPAVQSGDVKKAVTKALKDSLASKRKTKKSPPVSPSGEPDWDQRDLFNKGDEEAKRWVS